MVEFLSNGGIVAQEKGSLVTAGLLLIGNSEQDTAWQGGPR